MSIKDVIKSEVRQGRLVVFCPEDHSKRTQRHMFVHEEIDRRLRESLDTDDAEGLRFGYLRAILENYVHGGLITVAMNPYRKNRSALWAKTDPAEDEIWDIRVVDPNASLRVLGGFAMPDVFIALEYEFRENLDTGIDMPLWKKFIQRAKTKWRLSFDSYLRHSGERSSDYITENTVDV
uniref:hypothetical protein n=1 Tax=Pararhizobium sp. IMCC3301 TaxID=3067904 RepID=UPI0027413B5B|nr:hypothetical protein [Pararhizobium sp. IMCC3301]